MKTNPFFLIPLLIGILLCSCQGSDKARPLNNNEVEYLGKWKVSNTLGKSFEIDIHSDGSAESTWDEGESGKWRILDDRIHLIWKNGWNDFIYKDNGDYIKVAYAPGENFNQPPTSRAKAEKISHLQPESEE